MDGKFILRATLPTAVAVAMQRLFTESLPLLRFVKVIIFESESIAGLCCFKRTAGALGTASRR